MEIRTTSDSPKWSKVSMLDSEIENGLQHVCDERCAECFNRIGQCGNVENGGAQRLSENQ